MLIKKMSGNTDFDRALHKRMLMAAGMLCVGLVGFACYFLLVRGSGLEDYTRGFYLGGASGITFGALGFCCTSATCRPTPTPGAGPASWNRMSGSR